MARTKRVHLFAKGLTALGNDVKIVIPVPTEKRNFIKNDIRKGVFDSVKFHYAWCSVTRSDWFLGRRIHDFLGEVIAFFICLRHKPDIVFIISDSVLSYLFLKLLCILTGSKLVREITEVPFYNKESLNYIHKLKIKMLFSLYDGLVVISKSLSNYFSNDCSFKKEIFIVPIITEISQIPLPPSLEINNSLVYTGSLTQRKDGILTMINAFLRILHKHPSLMLILTGDLESSDVKGPINKLILDNYLQEKIVFKGYLSENELSNLINTAKILLLTKANTRQNKYNSATKVGEYLRSARPVLISNVDPVCEHLVHRESAFIVDPDEISIARELDFILNNPGLANEVGANGRLAAIESFNYLKQTERLNEYFVRLWMNNKR